ncbi:tRNA dihydrouridine synthase DusB [Clostridiaceae bacterium M8S5]|nr:tRNA dihydrouridine synthase DusB [Clostridiaceae bacterium M8S5]
MKIGNIEITNNVFLAPLAGITDMPFRILCKEQGAGLVYSEMVSCKGMYYNDKKTEELLITNDKERPIAAQIFGSDPKIMSEIVYTKLNKREDIDIIDVNMGCPVPKVVKNGDGSALLKKPEQIKDIVKSLVDVSSKPITVKIRTGWDANSINAVEVAKTIEQAGASAVAVHGRTREQFYSGTANWDIIKEVKKAVSIPVIGNGDIFEPQDALRMINQTNCDAVMIGRGCRGNPWIFSRILALFRGEHLPQPTDGEKIDMAIRHLRLLCTVKREDIAVKEMRKHIGWYTKGMKNSAELRGKINTYNNKDDMIKALRVFLEGIK